MRVPDAHLETSVRDRHDLRRLRCAPASCGHEVTVGWPKLSAAAGREFAESGRCLGQTGYGLADGNLRQQQARDAAAIPGPAPAKPATTKTVAAAAHDRPSPRRGDRVWRNRLALVTAVHPSSNGELLVWATAASVLSGPVRRLGGWRPARQLDHREARQQPTHADHCQAPDRVRTLSLLGAARRRLDTTAPVSTLGSRPRASEVAAVSHATTETALAGALGWNGRNSAWSRSMWP